MALQSSDTVLRVSMRAPEGFSEGIKPWALRPLGFAASGLPSGALTLPLSTVLAASKLSLGDSFSTLPLGFSTVAFKQIRIRRNRTDSAKPGLVLRSPGTQFTCTMNIEVRS